MLNATDQVTHWEGAPRYQLLRPSDAIYTLGVVHEHSIRTTGNSSVRQTCKVVVAIRAPF